MKLNLDATYRPLRSGLWWVALLVLLLNDHLLKGSGLLSGAITGKVSDVAGLLMAPACLIALFRLRHSGAFVAVYAGVGGLFTLINVSDLAARSVERLLPWYITVDPTDLYALAVMPLAYALWHHRPSVSPKGRNHWLERAGMALGATAIMATSCLEPDEPLNGELALEIIVQPSETVPDLSALALHQLDRDLRVITEGGNPVRPDWAAALEASDFKDAAEERDIDRSGGERIFDVSRGILRLSHPEHGEIRFVVYREGVLRVTPKVNPDGYFALDIDASRASHLAPGDGQCGGVVVLPEDDAPAVRLDSSVSTCTNEVPRTVSWQHFGELPSQEVALSFDAETQCFSLRRITEPPVTELPDPEQDPIGYAQASARNASLELARLCALPERMQAALRDSELIALSGTDEQLMLRTTAHRFTVVSLNALDADIEGDNPSTCALKATCGNFLQRTLHERDYPDGSYSVRIAYAEVVHRDRCRYDDRETPEALHLRLDPR